MIEQSRIKREIRHRGVSNMQGVMGQILFSHQMSGSETCCNEADAFLMDVYDLLLGYLKSGVKLATEQVEQLISKHTMNVTAQTADEISRRTTRRDNLIEQAIRTFLQQCQLVEENQAQYEERHDVNDVVDWWYGKMGLMCSVKPDFFTEDFALWTVHGVSLQFLLYYHIPKALAKAFAEHWVFDPKDLLLSSIEYRRDEEVENYLNYLAGSTDEELAKRANYILHQEACMVYDDRLNQTARYLIDAKLYEEWADLFIRVELPLLQCAMLYSVTELPDLMGVMEILLQRSLERPLTVFSVIREYFYDLCCKTTANLLSYQEGYYTREPGGELQKLSAEVWKQWEEEAPDYIFRGLDLLKQKLESIALAGWAFKKEKIVYARKNANTDGCNWTMNEFKQQSLKLYRPSELPIVAGDLQYLLYVADISFAGDAEMEKESALRLLGAMIETVTTTKIPPISKIDDKLIGDCDIAARLLRACYPDCNSIFQMFDHCKTWYEGWNVKPASMLYDGCHSECHLLCWMLMVASLDFRDGNAKHHYWVELMETMFRQVRAAGGYIRSEYTQTLVLGGMVAVQAFDAGLELFMEKCCQYVIGIDELVTIITNAGITQYLKEHTDKRTQYSEIISKIGKRIEQEWPLRAIRMNQEGPQARQIAEAISKAAEDWKIVMR